jgi:hypothetical protein
VRRDLVPRRWRHPVRAVPVQPPRELHLDPRTRPQAHRRR